MMQGHVYPTDGSHWMRPSSQLEATAAQLDRCVSHDPIALADLPGCGIVQAQTPASACPDPLMEGLVRALLPREQADEALRGFYTDVLHVTLVKRLAVLRNDTAHGLSGRRLTRLQSWRLRRVYDYVEHNLGEPLTLADLAGAAGLSRMHFAAQFRVATGMKPHAYVTHRRILRAKTMLSQTNMPIVAIALCVGFKTQPHFTTVFRRFVGYTPQHWRMLGGETILSEAA
jgi:AraC family transcriptional regulator